MNTPATPPPSTPARPAEGAKVPLPEINDNIFTYDGGMRQNIGNFGRNLKDDIIEAIRSRDSAQSLCWGVDELVRWCRGFNGELQRLKQQAEPAPASADAAERCVAFVRKMSARYEDEREPTIQEVVAFFRDARALAAELGGEGETGEGGQ